MCGIAGVIGGAEHPDVTKVIEALTTAMAHRGPDGFGFQYFNGRRAAFGHRRLSIVDIAGGHQPMSNEDGTVWLVLNGEIYNHAPLRKELESAGHCFKTDSDVEVVIHGWEEWGKKVLARMNGMYALALFDGRAGGDGEMWIARDPVGVKPLYVGRRGGLWWFASELAAAGSAGLLGGGYRPEAFAEYLVYRFVPSPGTFFRKAWKVPPGHCCRIDLNGGLEEPRFEIFPTAFRCNHPPSSRGAWKEAIREELAAAVQRQLMSDVPVGALLSGGVDSTLVTARMKAVLGTAPQSFAIGFSDVGDVDELTIARRAAVALGVPLAEVSITEAEYLAAWPTYSASFGEPIANSGLLLIGMLCRLVSQTHKVVLTGQGADEPLGGYPRHVAERIYPIAKYLGPLLGMLPERMFRSDRLARMRRVVKHQAEAPRFAEILAVFSPTDAVKMSRGGVTNEQLVEPVAYWLALEENDDPVARLLSVDRHMSLADDLLIVADHTSMASSVELRVPFLDLEFLALIDQLPSRYKISWKGERKWLYRDAVESSLPAALRPALSGWRAKIGTKLGFSTPLDRWLGVRLESEGVKFMGGSAAVLPEFVNAESFLAAVRGRGLARGRQLSALFTLEAWLREREGVSC